MGLFRILTLQLLFALITCFSVAQTHPAMVQLNGGWFTMGDRFGLGDQDELPVHRVFLRPYRIATTETTVAQWRIFCEASGHSMPNPPPWGWQNDHPIVNVSWEEALAYCRWLSGQTGQHFRLPTEAEWEFAASGAGLDSLLCYAGSASVDQVAWVGGNIDESTHPVAKKSPNAAGLYDMSGNALEWCADWYSPYHGGSRLNPMEPLDGPSKVQRGGSWNMSAYYARIACRNDYSQSDLFNCFGFRVAAD